VWPLAARVAVMAVFAGCAVGGNDRENDKTFRYAAGLWRDLPHSDDQATEGVPNLTCSGRSWLGVSLAVDDPAPCEVVRGELDPDFVSDHDPNPEFPHLAAGVGEHLVMTAVEHDTVGATSEGLHDRADELDCLFLGGDDSPPDTRSGAGRCSSRAAPPRHALTRSP